MARVTAPQRRVMVDNKFRAPTLRSSRFEGNSKMMSKKKRLSGFRFGLEAERDGLTRWEKG
jgi:hypothetical protein